MAAGNEHCVLAIECISGNIKDLALTAVERLNDDDKLYQLLLCNSIGTTVDCKYAIKPRFLFRIQWTETFLMRNHSISRKLDTYT